MSEWEAYQRGQRRKDIVARAIGLSFMVLSATFALWIGYVMFMALAGCIA